jgi:protein-L-isoaspartate(D-aspartate) O-methyltransferase
VKNTLIVRFFLFIIFIIIPGFIMPQTDKFEAARLKMVKTQIEDRGLTNTDVLEAMKKVPRHLFVPRTYQNEAYNDYPLPIGYQQTISQPFIVAYMTNIVKPGKEMKALEIGTGSGYQAAVLAEIVDHVYTIEIIPELARESSERLKQLGYQNITCKYGDGYQGWPEHAPFDIIIITAAVENIPQPLIDQLAEKGRMVVPVGKPHSVQELQLITKKHGKINIRHLTLVRFVPFMRL